MNNKLADVSFGSFKGIGSSTLANPNGNGISNLSSFISGAIGIMTIVAIIWFVFVFITGAIGIISAGGGQRRTGECKEEDYKRTYWTSYCDCGGFCS